MNIGGLKRGVNVSVTSFMGYMYLSVILYFYLILVPLALKPPLLEERETDY